jgi:hypothetical protein
MSTSTVRTDGTALGTTRPVYVLRSVSPEIKDSTHAAKVKIVLITGGVLSSTVRGVTS